MAASAWGAKVATVAGWGTGAVDMRRAHVVRTLGTKVGHRWLGGLGRGRGSGLGPG